MGIIFRKIAGRLVTITIKLEKGHTPGQFNLEKKIVAIANKGKGVKAGEARAGVAHFRVPKSGTHVNLEDIRVPEKFREQGIAKEIWKHASKLFGRSGKKFIRGYDIQHPAQIKIRNMNAQKTVFGVHGVGKYGEQSMKISKAQAQELTRHIQRGTRKGFSNVTATSMISKKFRGKK